MDYDVICLGGGGAGVATAVTAAAAGARVAILSKEPVGYGNTRLAGGNQVFTGLVPEDSEDAFVADLLAGGEYLNHPVLARVVAREAPDGVHMLESMGHLFKRDVAGLLSEAVAIGRGGHSLRRAVSSPSEGNGMGQALRAAAACAGVDVYEETLACRLIADEQGVRGVVALRLPDGQVTALLAGAVVIATGGAGWLYYPHSDCHPTATGDGYALALAVGAELADMEFVQFVPFAVTHPDAMIGLALGDPADAGPEAVLRNGAGDEVLRNIGRRTRAEVSRAIAREMAAGKVTPYGGLELDVTPNLKTPEGRAVFDRVKEKFIVMLAKAAYGPKAGRWEEPWDVCPTAHFNMGGIRVDEHGRTTVPGLYAVGEAQVGTHGANRIGSVALAELFVFGRRAGEDAARQAASSVPDDPDPTVVAAAVAEVEALFGRQGTHRPVELIRRLQRTMWENVGLVRTEAKGEAALAAIADLAQAADDIRTGAGRPYNTEVADSVQLRLMLGAARAIATAALLRRESRGAHFRADFPERHDHAWRRNIVLSAPEGCLQWRLVAPGGA